VILRFYYNRRKFIFDLNLEVCQQTVIASKPISIPLVPLTSPVYRSLIKKGKIEGKKRAESERWYMVARRPAKETVEFVERDIIPVPKQP
jgi:hypothetical protein